MLRSEKKSFVTELEGIYESSNSVIVTHYHGLTVAEVTKLRRNLRENGASFKVVKNTLSKIAASNAGLAGDSEIFSGPTAIAYSEDPVAAAKSVVEFAKTNDNLKIIGGVVNNTVLDVSAIQQLAKLPSLDVLRGQIVGILQTPAANLARVLQAPAGALARVMQAYADKN
ncbi:MAG: 50S ribosomal protein L10 [Rickettsiaceae bacterium]|nr:50S ribosomal protein L10 [Rickettsiaceae bacterium]MDP4832596.1 50S ribosomal protein L10 [Rickettsiaceae bacterium]MDP5021165.1 50S ribosomal protein L10 [Rickettsiaceae bacterium]MDP5083390.1 50S ribosomal protein L10 [Rickettsiaceae bacterium]